MSTPKPPSSPFGRSRRRKERANVKKRLRGVYIRSPELSPHDIRVVNISELGLGIETESFVHAPELNEDIEIKLVVGRTTAPVVVRVVHMTEEVTGIEFINPSDLIRGAVRNYFEPELVGASMRPLKKNAEQRPGDPLQLEFKDTESNTLCLNVQDERLVAFSIGILGNSVEWKQGGTVQIIQNDRAEPVGDYLRNQLIKFAQSVEALSPELQQDLEEILLLNAPSTRAEKAKPHSAAE